MIHDTWYMIHDTWYTIHDIWYMKGAGHDKEAMEWNDKEEVCETSEGMTHNYWDHYRINKQPTLNIHDKTYFCAVRSNEGTFWNKSVFPIPGCNALTVTWHPSANKRLCNS